MTTTVTTTVTTTTSPVPPPPPTPPPPASSWQMPDLVGQTLQDAQDAIQAVTSGGIFFTYSTDATGQDRAQVVDSNWVVCSQNIAAGATIDATTRIEFAAVKSGERCP